MPVPSDPADLLAAARSGDRASLARLLTLVEGPSAQKVIPVVYPHTGKSVVVGFTGAPGAGKSTLVSAVVSHLRSRGDEVAVLAVDPTSPFSGGAILGDRVRMGDHALDDGVFVRSMASRGALGGLAGATPNAIRVLDAAGKPHILLETVGVGQVEVEVVETADTVVVVLNPGWGDAVQASKAGLMEIADVFAVNKADRPGAEDTIREVEQMLDMAPADTGWRPPVVPTVGTDGTGVAEFWDAIEAHREHLLADGAHRLRERRRAHLGDEIRNLVAERIARAVRRRCVGPGFEQLVDECAEFDTDPQSASVRIIGEAGLDHLLAGR